MRLPTIFKSKQKFLPFIIVYHKNSLLLWQYDNINTLKTQAYVVNKVTAESTFQIKSSARNDWTNQLLITESVPFRTYILFELLALVLFYRIPPIFNAQGQADWRFTPWWAWTIRCLLCMRSLGGNLVKNKRRMVARLFLYI